MAAKAKARKPAKPARAGLKAAKVDVWVATIQDRAGGAADRLERLAEAGASLEMVLARRTEEAGRGVMFVTPIKGAKATQAAQKTGFGKPTNIYSVRIQAVTGPASAPASRAPWARRGSASGGFPQRPSARSSSATSPATARRTLTGRLPC